MTCPRMQGGHEDLFDIGEEARRWRRRPRARSGRAPAAVPPGARRVVWRQPDIGPASFMIIADTENWDHSIGLNAIRLLRDQRGQGVPGNALAVWRP